MKQKTLKQGSIFMLKYDSSKIPHPSVLIGNANDNSYALLLFTSFKKTENGKYESYHSKKLGDGKSTNFNSIYFQPFFPGIFQNNNETKFLFDLDISDGLKFWSQTDIRNLYFIDKNYLYKQKIKGEIKDKSWQNLINKYKSINCLDLLGQNNNSVKYITSIRNFSYEKQYV